MSFLLEIIPVVSKITFKIILVLIPLLFSVAYLIYFERKVIGWMQLRQGPTLVGFWGLLQPFADALKLLFKETIIPNKANKFIFFLAPIITFTLAMIGWAAIPWGAKVIHNAQDLICPLMIKPSVIANINVGVLYLLAISSMGIYGIIIAGWASNSTYSFLGAIRSASQMISYEIAIGSAIVAAILVTGSLNIAEMVVIKHSAPWWQDLLLLPMVVIFFIALLAETNRHPFDLPEAEAELVAGYNVEYSSMSFALFFLGEYANMILGSAILASLFLGGWYPPFGLPAGYIPGVLWLALKITFILFCFIWVRATIPRYRFDQLMAVGWKTLLPISLIWVVVIASVLFYTDTLPATAYCKL